jgi:succinate dehydrogenase / fumarate reductase flavoprotein subunit
VDINHPAFKEAEKEVREGVNKLIAIKGTRTPDDFHRALGKIMWDNVGMARTADGLTKAIAEMKALKDEFWKDLKVSGVGEELNEQLEKAGRTADFLELGILMAEDALDRNESCGGHFRLEYQTPEGEAMRDDENYSYVAAWEYMGENVPEKLNKEDLKFEFVHPSQRSYK